MEQRSPRATPGRRTRARKSQPLSPRAMMTAACTPRAREPQLANPCATAAEAHTPKGQQVTTISPCLQLLKPAALELAFRNKRSHYSQEKSLQTREACEPQLVSTARSLQLEKVHQQQRLSAVKNKHINNK